MTTPMGAPRPQSAPAERANRYLVAFVVVGSGLVATIAIQGAGADTFAPLVGAVAISCWYGGLWPGLVAVVLGYITAWFTLDSPSGPWDLPQGSELLRWLAPLLVSLVVVWGSWALRRVGRKAEARAETAEREQFMAEAVQRLASELSSAVTPSEVAHALVERTPRLLGATGAALGLLDGGDLRIVDPAGASRQTLAPGRRLSLDTKAPITVAARTGEVASASTRKRFEHDYPDGASLAPEAAGALAVPLSAGGKIVGSMGFPFGQAGAIDDEIIAVARLAADLGGQALERAGLYEQERLSREGLDRILRLAPLSDSESPESVVELICKEAVNTFGSDVAQVWATVDDGLFDVVWREPPSDVIPPGTRVRASDYPGLIESMRRREALFVPDSWASVEGTALEQARHLGIRSSLRVPIAAGGRVERVLALQWTRVLPELPTSTIALARRFADQAGLALEHVERRVAQIAASRNAEETRRLLDVTASLAAALEPSAVATAILREAFKGLDATAGVVVRLSGDSELELITAVGYPDHVLAEWGRFALVDNVPLADAVRRNEIVALESPSERARRYPAFSRVNARHGALLAIPLVAGGRVVGGLGLSFESARPFSDGDREFGLALSRQAGQALERSSLLETEHAARMRAERMASDLAQLHALATSLSRAGAATDVTRIVGEQIVHGVGAGSAGVYVFGADRKKLSLLDVNGRLERDDLAAIEQMPLDEAGPIGAAVRTGGPVWLVEDLEWDVFPATASWRATGVSALGVVPLVVEQEVIGALFVAFDDGVRPSDEDRRFVETLARQAAQPLERSRLFDEERVMRRRADRLQELTAALSGALTPDEVVDVFIRQASAAVDASGVAMGILDQESRIQWPVGWRDDGSLVPTSWLDTTMGGRTPLRDAIRHGRALYFDDIGSLLTAYPGAGDLVGSDEHRSFAFVPVVVGRKPFAVTVLAWDRPPLVGDERAFIETIASQCGQAIDRAQRYETERTIAETLQRSVLPETLPSMEGATVAARYLPGTAAMDVGGDWFDTIPLDDGRLGFVVGDVVGKGVQAASTMAQLRNGMRALTLDSSDPGRIVTKLNRLLDGYSDAPFATLAFVTVDPVTHEATVISAGHLPPLVLSPGREPRLLEGGRGLPLGVAADTSYEPWSTTLEAGSVIVLYTDGLVERRDRPLDEGLRLLAEAAAEATFDPEEVVDLVIDRLIGDSDRGDDVAVLVVALDRSPLGTFAVRLPADRESLVELRHAFGRWLEKGGIAEADRRDLMLATWEATANAVEHARDPSGALIAVQANLAGDKVRVEVSDTGTWREPRERPDRGLGLRLMQSLMTSFTVEQGDQGTRVIMERTLSRERAGEGGTGAATDHRRP